MFIGRTQEQKQLDAVYISARNSAVVLYGRKGMGKTELVRKFSEGKPSVYFLGRELSERELKFQMNEELLGGNALLPVDAELSAPSYFETLYAAIMREGFGGKRVVVVLDEFEHIAKGSTEFAEAFVKLLNDVDLQCMFILTSSSVNWVENDMVKCLGMAARSLSGIIKLKPFTFVEMVNRFPKLSIEDTICASAVLGGVPEYLNYWNEKKSVKENITALFLSKNSPLFNETEILLKSELRELSAYNAILSTMAKGNYKLNDIYARTGFSRAKISVYIKNLIELDLVEKIFSFDAAEHANVQKGLYKISDNFLNFSYRFVFPNLSHILARDKADPYQAFVAPGFDAYMRECFKDVCSEYLKIMGKYKKLKADYTNWGSWYGKAGLVDIVAGNDEGKCLVGFCRFDSKRVTVSDFADYEELIHSAMIEPEEIYVFSKTGFSADFNIFAKRQGVVPVELSDL
ncbi:MAG: ATP-binding protein [Lachnospiraceae bacterium]|nr:ATP-binding protein [Lachnospiraceae bacterium]